VAELIVLLVAVRLITWAWTGDIPALADLRTYLIQPASVIDFALLAYAVLIFFAWDRSTSFAGIFTDLALTPAEITYYSSKPAERSDIRSAVIVPRNRGQLMQGYLRQWMIGGLILAFFATLTTFRLSDLPAQGVLNLPNLSRLGLRPELLAALLVYFLGGLWLASQARVDVLKARWLIDGSQVDKGIARSWQRASPLLLLAAAAIAAFLPIGSTFAISRIVQVLANLVLVVVGAIVALASLILFLLASLLSSDAQEQPLPPLDLESSIPQYETNAVTGDTAALIAGSLFWVLFISAAVLATVFFLRGRGIRIEPGQAVRIWRQLAAWLKSLWTGVTGRLQTATITLANRLNTARENVSDAPWSWPLVRIGRLSPREQVRFYYLAAVRRATKGGIERASSETPLEYASHLQADLPEYEDDVEALTTAFLKARYSREPVDKRELAPIRKSWKRLRSALRRASTR
jgi:hypothetical protein